MKKINVKRIRLFALFLAIAFLVVAFAVWIGFYVERKKAYDVKPLSEEDLKNVSLECTKLMIVAHPDDETLWGGAHLKEGCYLVVCLTRGRDSVRKAEFEEVIKKSGNVPMILEYPDKVNMKRDSWSEVKDGMKADLSLLIGMRDWDLVVTHNPEGEYGHAHHIMTSEMVTEISKQKNMYSKLMYMGRYYKKDEIDKVAPTLKRVSDDELKFKENLLNIYTSQGKTVDKLSHMNPYEMWTAADEWR